MAKISQLLRTDGVTLGELRQAAEELTPELYLGLCPFPALLECLAPPPEEAGLDAQAAASAREEGLKRRLECLRQDRDAAQRRLFFLKPSDPKRQVVVGRSAGHADTVVPEGTVSKRHLRLTSLEGRRWTAMDLESANGSWLEGNRLPAGIPTPLLSGQTLLVSTFTTIFLQPEQIWSLIAPRSASSQLVLPPTGLAIKELITSLTGMGQETFLSLCPHPFLLQVPTEAAPPPEEEQEGFDATLPLSRTRIISLQRRSSKLSGALVHYLDPEVGVLTLGRAGGGCALTLPEKSVSKRHAEIRKAGDRWLVTDLGSHNGVWIEGQRIESGLATALEEGQSVSFSSYRCLFLPPQRVWDLIQAVAKRS